MAKLFASQVAERVASQCVEVFGGNGFVRDYPAEKYYRDAKIGKIYEGTRTCSWPPSPNRCLSDRNKRNCRTGKTLLYMNERSPATCIASALALELDLAIL